MEEKYFALKYYSEIVGWIVGLSAIGILILIGAYVIISEWIRNRFGK